MSVIAIIGASGGAGATTVTAHLATAIAQQDKPVLCFDFCPTNLLGLHFGAAFDAPDGFATALTAGLPWQQSAYASAAGVRFLPFGALEDDATLEQLCNWLDARPHWFRDSIAAIDLPADTIVLCDCPRLPAALRRQVLAAADIVLVVCTPDPLSLAAATRLAGQLQDDAGRLARILLNGYEAGRSLDRDMQLILRRLHGGLAAPVTLHRDESLREALASKQTVFDYAPDAQAALEFAALATWAIMRGSEQPSQGSEHADHPDHA